MSEAAAAVIPPVTETLFLAPEQLTRNEANEKARPGETAAEHEARVDAMMQSIRLNGQKYPVLIAQVTDVADDGSEIERYEYVDGEVRVEAIAKLAAEGNGGPDVVRCEVLPEGTDLFRTAVVGNLHRTQNSLLQMAGIVQETRERNGWTGRGGSKLTAEYLGIQPSRVSEYEKLLRAPNGVKAKIESGQITALDAALKIMTVPESQRDETLRTAQEIADEEKEQRKAKERATRTEKLADAVTGIADDSKADDRPEPQPDGSADESKPARVTGRHVAEAARRTSPQTSLARSRQQLLDPFKEMLRRDYNPGSPAKEFLQFFVAAYAPGVGGQNAAQKLIRLFDVATSEYPGRKKDDSKAAPSRDAGVRATAEPPMWDDDKPAVKAKPAVNKAVKKVKAKPAAKKDPKPVKAANKVAPAKAKKGGKNGK